MLVNESASEAWKRPGGFGGLLWDVTCVSSLMPGDPIFTVTSGPSLPCALDQAPAFWALAGSPAPVVA